MNKDVVGLLLHHLDPKTALELRGCSHQLNRWVSHNDLFWYYQTLGYGGRKYGSLRSEQEGTAAGATKVHVKQWGLSCINDRTGYCHPDYTAAYASLLERSSEPEMLEEEMWTAARLEMEKWPALDNEGAELYGKRSVCIKHYMEVDHKFCGRREHFQLAYEEQTIVGDVTQEFLEAKREKEGLWMFKFLFQCYRDTRKKVQNVKTETKAEVRAQGLRDHVRLLESQIQTINAELAVLDNFPRLQEAVKTSVFNRRSEKNYHTRKEVSSTF